MRKTTIQLFFCIFIIFFDSHIIAAPTFKELRNDINRLELTVTNATDLAFWSDFGWSSNGLWWSYEINLQERNFLDDELYVSGKVVHTKTGYEYKLSINDAGDYSNGKNRLTFESHNNEFNCTGILDFNIEKRSNWFMDWKDIHGYNFNLTAIRNNIVPEPNLAIFFLIGLGGLMLIWKGKKE